MSIELATKYSPKVDEMFAAESKLSLLTNTDYDWTGTRTVKVYKISTAPLNDYARNRYDDDYAGEDASALSISRYGNLVDLNAATEEMMLKNDKSFIFNIDKLDADETARALQSTTALARQIRQVVIPTVDKYVYGVMAANAGTKATAATLTVNNVYDAILAGSETEDDEEVPDTQRVLVVTPAVYKLLKKAAEFDNTDIGAEMKLRGVVGILDGMAVIKVPTARLPENFGFMIAHPSATTAPVKLADYGTHDDTPLSSGTIVTGRVAYDAFVLNNKAKGIYTQPVEATEPEGEDEEES